MNPAARLHAALDLLEALERASRPADAEVSAWLRGRRDIPEADRGEILEALDDLLRRRARLDWRLARERSPATPRLRLLAWLVLARGLERDRAGAMLPGGPSADERALASRLQGGTLDHPEMPPAVRLECPGWAFEPLRARFGDSFEAEMAAMLAPPSLDLRVNPLKASRDGVLADLRALGFEAQACPLSPLGVRLPGRTPLHRLPMLRTGEAEIQDEGSQLVALAVGAQPGERVVDFCAGAGGKTLALAAQMQNRGHVIACDVSEPRLKRAAQRFRNAGLHNIQTRVLESARDRWVKRHKGGFDRVLVDAPCSGTGTWRRNPDARWREAGLGGLPALQAEILDSAARLVRPGGRLVYATCSLLAVENEAQVDGFLAAHPDFQVAAPHLSLTPAHHGTDGFFAAVMTRAETP